MKQPAIFNMFAITLFTLFCLAGMTGCAGLERKAVGIASGIDAVKIETTGSISSGTLLPNLTLGGAVNAVATSPALEPGQNSAPVYVRSSRSSFLGELFGVHAVTETVAYIGTPGETAAETEQRVNAFSPAARP